MNQELYDQMLNAGLVMLYREKGKRELLKINGQVKAKERLLEEKKRRINEMPAGYSGKKGWGLFFVIFGSILDLVIGITILVGLGKASNSELEDFFLGFIVILPVIFLGIILLISAKKHRKKYIIQATEEYKIEEEKYIAYTKEATEEVKRRGAAAEDFNAKHSHFLDFLPKKYHDLMAIGFMLEAISNLRADTLKEVINLYEEELHRLTLERIAENSARMQQLQNERMLYAMEQLNENQERINSNLQDIKTMQFVDMINNA